MKYVILKLGRASFVCTKEQHHIHQEKKNFNKEKTKKRGKPQRYQQRIEKGKEGKRKGSTKWEKEKKEPNNTNK